MIFQKRLIAADDIRVVRFFDVRFEADQAFAPGNIENFIEHDHLFGIILFVISRTEYAHNLFHHVLQNGHGSHNQECTKGGPADDKKFKGLVESHDSPALKNITCEDGSDNDKEPCDDKHILVKSFRSASNGNASIKSISTNKLCGLA